MGIPVAEMLSRMSSKELTEWMAFSNIEPFGYRADFVPHAQTATVIANTSRGKNTDPYKVEDFMPGKKAKSEQTTEEMIGVVASLNQVLGGKDNR